MEYSDILFTILLSLVAVGVVVIFILLSWGLVWKLLLSRFEFLRAILTDSSSDASQRGGGTGTNQRRRPHHRPAANHRPNTHSSNRPPDQHTKSN